MTIEEARPSRRQHKPIEVSFEFFPPKIGGNGERRCGRRSSASRRCGRNSSPSPMAPAARPASALTRPSRASCARPRSSRPRISLASARRATKWTRSRAAIGRRACAISWRLRGDPQGGLGTGLCADARRLRPFHRSGARSARHRRFRNLGFGLSGKASGKRRSTRTSTCSRRRSTPAQRARSRSSSSRTISISAFSTACWRRGSRSPSCPA